MKINQRQKKKFKPNAAFIILCVILVIYAAFIIFMLLWGLNTSLKSKGDFEYLGNYMGFPQLDKNAEETSYGAFFHLANYKTIIQNFKYLNKFTYYRGSQAVSRQTQTLFGTLVGAKNKIDLGYEYFPDMILNTLVYVGGAALVSSFVPALTAYLTAKYNYKYSGIVFVAYTLMMCMPIVGSQPAQLAFLQRTGLYDTMIGIILQWASGGGLYFFVFYAYFKSVPETYREAASIDGAGEFTIMARVYFPLAIKMVSTVFLLMFVSLWNDYQTPMVFLPTKPTLAFGVFYFSSMSGDPKFYNDPTKIAANMILALPILALFIIFKNKLMGDISLGGIKE